VSSGAYSHLGQCAHIAARGTGNLHALVGFVGLFRFQRPGQLIQEHRNAVFKLLRRGSSLWPLRNLDLAPLDQFVPVAPQEVMHLGVPG